MNERRYWIAVAPRDHAAQGVANGFVELTYGRAEPLARLMPGDGLLVYSPRESAPHGEPLQAFTAIGRVRDAPIYQAPRDHQPFRRAVHWLPCVPAPVKPLLDALTFVRNKAHWGAAFRFGMLRVSRDDFAAIAIAMGRDPAADFADAL
jgi:hypothetical protein